MKKVYLLFFMLLLPTITYSLKFEVNNRLAYNELKCGDENLDIVVLKKRIPLKDQLIKRNTVYVIKDKFILENNITIPDNCVLFLEGGSIKGNYAISGTSFSLVGKKKSFINVRRINS